MSVPIGHAQALLGEKGTKDERRWKVDIGTLSKANVCSGKVLYYRPKLAHHAAAHQLIASDDRSQPLHLRWTLSVGVPLVLSPSPPRNF